ncbi:hypothetical protein LELG_05327 [Lodderomyces elongisporus NRRL YB-4239]|uniref:Uncharacterized protein n=1 Tax=Lodderomyces elongisporus (strain ATCC 11503 / CBS 2605 / JCM 1781 / NBRC 1676 / NRRL YB-4239) TaxID=379508 RepID=A5E6T8_LODEL|nr:hypothetical protein LELG_05327 [Lodderomyces elongisporus NRRL YB-4239]
MHWGYGHGKMSRFLSIPTSEPLLVPAIVCPLVVTMLTIVLFFAVSGPLAQNGTFQVKKLKKHQQIQGPCVLHVNSAIAELVSFLAALEVQILDAVVLGLDEELHNSIEVLESKFAYTNLSEVVQWASDKYLAFEKVVVVVAVVEVVEVAVLVLAIPAELAALVGLLSPFARAGMACIGVLETEDLA